MDSDFEAIVNMMLSFFREIEDIDENVAEPEKNRRYHKIGGVTYLVSSNVGSAHKPLVADKISRLVKKVRNESAWECLDADKLFEV